MGARDGKFKIGIIGAGLGGLTAGALLSRRGHAVTVFERAREVRPVGAGLLLQPTGMGVLDRLGVGDRVRALGASVDRLHGTSTTGRCVMDLRYGDLRDGRLARTEGIGVHRAMLHRVLLDAAAASGSELITGADVVSVTQDGLRARVGLARDGSGGRDDVERRDFDLVVIADGARSAMRSAGGRVRRDRRYGWGALWFVAHNPPASLVRTLRQVYDGTPTMLGFLPSGRIDQHGSETVSMFWSVRERAWRDGFEFAFAAWQHRVSALLPEASPVFDQIRSAEDLIYAPYFDVDVRQSRGRVAVIGDAAHAMSPQLGQGANLAMLDATDLADAIDEMCASGERDSIPDAVMRASRRGRVRTAYYRAATRGLNPWFQSDRPAISPSMGMVRDLAMGPACRFPPTRAWMLRTLTGFA